MAMLALFRPLVDFYDVVDENGTTPIMVACQVSDHSQALADAILSDRTAFLPRISNCIYTKE